MSALRPGDLVKLESVPSSLLEDLPEEDQVAIRNIIGHTVMFVGYSHGQVEIEFKDDSGSYHSIWVDEKQIKRVKTYACRSRSRGATMACIT